MHSAKGIRLQRRHERVPTTLTMGEAFSLMKYQNKVTGRVEWLWNSRDGVTPFVIDDPLCPELHKARYREKAKARTFDPRTEPDPACMAHADWHEDAFVPNYVPTEGTRIFMSWSDAPEAYRKVVKAKWLVYVEQVRAAGGVSDEHCEGLLNGEPYGMEPHAPSVVVVSAALVEHFHALAKDNPFVPPAKTPVEGPALIMPDDPTFADHTKPLKL